MSVPLLLDLFCGAGGAARGYMAAGFRVVGVDINPQPNYPYEFHQADALEYPLEGFDAIHASPPCQAYTTLSKQQGKGYPDLVAATRERLLDSGVPYIIENVPGAPLIDPIVLCGTQFDLRSGDRWLRRHRLFESNVLHLLHPDKPCSCKGKLIGGVYGTGGAGQMTRGYKFHPDEAREAMGIDWMTRKELSQAIPPAYTQWLGYQLAEALRAAA